MLLTGTVAPVRLGRAGLSPRMVGRALELDRLRRLVDLAAGEPQVALVAGEGGVGKTRLVQELVAGLPESTSVLVGRASPGAPGRPYQLLVDAVASQVAGWTEVPAPLAHRREALELLLGPVAPGLAPCCDRTFSTEELHRSLEDLVRELVRPELGVLVLDDVHWADAESVGAFAHLAGAEELPLLIVATFRPEELGRRPPVAEALLELERTRGGTQLVLTRLDASQVAELLTAIAGRPIPARVATAVHRRTGGNPFFLEELLAAAGDLPPEQLADVPLPWSLAEIVSRQLEGLDGETRRVLDAAAVLGQRVDFDLLAAVAGVAEDRLIDALRALVTGGLVAEDEVDVFAFRHALTHQAVLDRLLGRERRRLHEKALAALQERGSADWPALAHHAAGAGRFEEMVEAARAGATEYLRRGSTSEALSLAELGLSEAEDDIALLDAACRAAWMTGRVEEAERHGQRWLLAAQTAGDAAAELDALRVLARLAWEANDGDRQQARAEEAVARAEASGRPELLAAAYNLMAEMHMLGRRPEAALEWADRALTHADRHGDRLARAAILVNKGSALCALAGRDGEAEALLDEARAAAAAVGDDFSLFRAGNNLLNLRIRTWPVERSRTLANEIRAVAERAGRLGHLGSAWVVDSFDLAEIEGDLGGARAVLAEARRAGGLGPRAAQWAAAFEAYLAAETAPLAEAAEAVEHARLVADVAGRGPLLLDEATAVLAARRDDAAAALAAAEAAAARRGPYAESCGEFAARALLLGLEAGLDPAAGRRLASQLDVVPAGGTGTDVYLADHLEAALLEAEGEPAAALAAYERATPAHFHRLATLVAAARAGQARCLATLGDRDAARQRAEAAAAALARWPGWRRERVDDLLRRLGAAPAPEGPGLLTPREREVASLVAAGLSNAEIGSRLYISTKTASVHVSNILMKLGMSSRTEVAAWAVRTGLVPT